MLVLMYILDFIAVRKQHLLDSDIAKRVKHFYF